MSEPTPKNESAEAQETMPTPEDKKSASASFLDRINLTQMTLAVLVVIFIWQWLSGYQNISEMRRQLAEKIAEMDGSNQANQKLIAQNQEQMRVLSEKVTSLEVRYAESQSQRAALESLYNDLSASRDETVLADVEQLLLIAEQQLQLSANVKAALIAMQSADSRLERMNRPAYNGLRKAIGQDMEKLRALPEVNVTALNFQLDTLIGMVDQLPPGFQQRAGAPAAKSAQPAKDAAPWQKFLHELWQEVRQLVRIENTGNAEIPLLLPEEEYFLRENLKLRLLSARLALQARDGKSFRLDVAAAKSWVVRYFNVKSAGAAQALEIIGKLSASDVGLELPEIGAGLQAVRTLRLSHQKAG
jgi:uroporphyrin-3 C-methyltransferase